MTHPTVSNAAARYRNFDELVAGEARRYLRGLVPPHEYDAAASRITLAFQAAAAVNPKIAEANPVSVAVALSQSCIYRLFPGKVNPGVYLTLRSGAVEWQISYHGYIDLAARVGVRLRARLVFVGDEFHVEEGSAPRIVHRPAPFSLEPGADDEVESLDNLRGGYVVATYPDGSEEFVVMRRSAILARRDRSPSGSKGRGPWADWPLEMALKTVLKYGFNRGLVSLSPALSPALDADEGLVDEPAPTRARPVEPAAEKALGGLASAVGADNANSRPRKGRDEASRATDSRSPDARPSAPPAPAEGSRESVADPAADADDEIPF